MTQQPPGSAPTRPDGPALFTGRADYYKRYRPGYPPQVVDLFEREVGWTPESVVADIGSGTGIASGMLLARGNTVFAIEPNAGMRHAAEEQWDSNPRFHSVDGTAERTTLPDASVDLVICATSFHWFDVLASRAEFRRILRPGGRVVLMWNVRRPDTPPLMAAYEQLLKQVQHDYAARVAREKRAVEQIATFFAPMPFERRTFENPQALDLEGLKGRFLSASYAPLPGEPFFERAMRELESLFGRFAVGGTVTFTYDTFVYWGRLD